MTDSPMTNSPVNETVGVFGGSFDPPHAAHVLFVSYVLSSVPLDRLLVIPTFEHPLDKSAVAAYEHRARMCELAMADLTRVEVSQIEADLGGSSRTLRTLEALLARTPSSRLRLLIGADILEETDRWHRWDRIVELAPPVVVGRSGYTRSGEVLPVALPNVSSTEVRDRLARGEDTTGLVPHRVADYIRQHRLYEAA
jgi:nicotinate-nucleotide adenylyltransferase